MATLLRAARPPAPLPLIATTALLIAGSAPHAAAQEGLVVQQLAKNASEDGGSTAVQIYFDTVVGPPWGNLTVDIKCDNPAEITVACETPLMFGPDDYNVTQFCQFKGVPDYVDDGDQAVTCTVGPVYSTDPGDYQDGAVWKGTVWNTDVDDAELRITPSSGLTTDEEGGTATASVVLGARPKAAVTFQIESTNTGEGKITGPTSFVFKPGDWNVSQSIELTGIDDADIDDDDQVYQITFTPLQSGDPQFNGVETPPLEVTNTDDDEAGVEVQPGLCDLQTWEDASKAPAAWAEYYKSKDIKPQEITLKLKSRPVKTVVIPLSTIYDMEVAFDKPEVVFSPAQWDQEQTVTVNGVPDNKPDGDVVAEVAVEDCKSEDPKYEGQHGIIRKVVNFDVDQPLIHVYPSCIETSEPDVAVEVVVGVAPEPTADVTIPIASNNTAEGKTSVDSVTLSAGKMLEVVGVTGQTDDYDDGDIPYKVTSGPATSTDTAYDGKSALDIPGINLDDDTAGVAMAPVSITEDQSVTPTANIPVKLTSKPYDTVVLSITPTYQNTSEYDDVFTISTLKLTFTPDVWNVEQTVSVSAFDNFIDEGPERPYALTTVGTSPKDPAYTGELTNPVLTVVNDDVAWVDLEVVQSDRPKGRFLTNETSLAQTIFTVVLESEPVAPVEVSASGVEVYLQSAAIFERELIFEPAVMTFTAANWRDKQTVVITPRDDDVADGLQELLVTFGADSEDPKYNTSLVPDVFPKKGPYFFDVGDNDEAGIALSGKDGLVVEPLVLEEGSPASTVLFTLATRPMCNYSEIFDPVDPGPGMGIRLSVDAAHENLIDITPKVIRVTGSDAWSTPQEIAILAIDDGTPAAAGIGNAVLTATVFDTCFQGDANPDFAYDGRTTSIDITLVDNDVPGVNLSYPTDADPLVVSEDGAKEAAFDVSLETKPTADVTVKFAFDETEIALEPAAEVVFKPNTWNVKQRVRVVGVDDDEVDGDQEVVVTVSVTSGDPEYAAIMGALGRKIVNEDDDVPGWRVERDAAGKLPPLTTTEGGESATISLRLSSPPTAAVTITTVIISDDTEAKVADGVLPITILPDNWDQEVAIIIEGVDDDEKDGNQMYTVTIPAPESEDPVIKALAPLVYDGVNIDDDAPGIAVTPTEATTTEAPGGATAVVSLRLQSKPRAEVPVSWAVDDATEGTVNPSMHVFTPENWGTPVDIVITGVDDTDIDGDVQYQLVFDPVVSGDADYNGVMIAAVTVTNTDDDGRSCTAYGGICADAACTVCCEAACGMCRAPGCSGEPSCCVDEITTTGTPCETSQAAPCVQVATPAPVPTSTACLDFQGLCEDDECLVCCAQTCGSCGGAANCGDGSGAAPNPNCCPGAILTAEPVSMCGAGGNAPCVRLDLCAGAAPCPPPGDECREQAVCDRRSGKCATPVAKADGTTCGAAGSGRSCEGGVCSRTVHCGGVLCERSADTCFPDVICEGDRCVPDPATAKSPGSYCDDGNPSTDGDACTADGCTGTPLCGDPSRVCSSEGACAVCCEDEAQCASTATVKEPCDGSFVNLPCVRVQVDCLAYGGVCADPPACTACCPLLCGKACVADADECLNGFTNEVCCGGTIKAPTDGTDPAVCSSAAPAPCVRVAKCEEFGGICEDEACEVCCAKECGVCGGPTCALHGADKCCPDAIRTASPPPKACEKAGDAPCLRGATDACTPYGGVCAGGSCEVCCDARCGGQCTEADCTASTSEYSCCATEIKTGGGGGGVLPKCTPGGVVPCSLVDECAAIGGICADEACTACCAGTCSACGGAAGCGEGPQCCDTTIKEEKKPCDAAGTAPPCVRADRCTEHDGVCSDASCTVCCDPSCPSCGTADAVCNDPALAAKCCTTSIATKATPCADADASAPCLRVTKCAMYGGICKDDACTVCCDASCETCGAADGGSCDGDAQCCDTDIAKTGRACSPTQGAPCTRVTKCSAVGGVCEDDACEVCCSLECGGCSAVSQGPMCPSVDEIKTGGVSCDAPGTTAPCVRLPMCAAFGGKCADDACEVCCDASCTQCGGPQCHLEGPGKCCPSTIATVGTQCHAATKNAPCVRVQSCSEFGGVCNDAACAVCCHPMCKTCGGPLCALDAMGADRCCPERITATTDPATGGPREPRVCGELGASAPCVRTDDPCARIGGVCNDADCVMCCDASCGGTCGSFQCTLPGGGVPDACCPREPGSGKPTSIATLPACTSTSARPCLRVDHCAAYGGLCRDDDCNVCCNAACGVCGGASCSSDPLGAGECCDTTIAAIGAPQYPSCEESGKAPCIRNAKCLPYGGICKDADCEVCCDAACGECDTAYCPRLPGGGGACCAGYIKAAKTLCKDSGSAPCVLDPNAISNNGGGSGSGDPNAAADAGDDGMPGWGIFLLILFLAVCCVAVLAAVYLHKKRQAKADYAAKEMKNQKEILTAVDDRSGLCDTDSPRSMQAASLEEVDGGEGQHLSVTGTNELGTSSQGGATPKSKALLNLQKRKEALNASRDVAQQRGSIDPPRRKNSREKGSNPLAPGEEADPAASDATPNSPGAPQVIVDDDDI